MSNNAVLESKEAGKELRGEIYNLLLAKGFKPHMTSFTVFITFIEYFVVNNSIQKRIKDAYNASPELMKVGSYSTICTILRTGLSEVNQDVLKANNPDVNYTPRTFITQCVNEILYGKL